MSEYRIHWYEVCYEDSVRASDMLHLNVGVAGHGSNAALVALVPRHEDVSLHPPVRPPTVKER